MVGGAGGNTGGSTGAGFGVISRPLGCVSASNAFMTIDSIVLANGKGASGAGGDDGEGVAGTAVTLVATSLERRRRLPLFLARMDLDGEQTVAAPLPLFSAGKRASGGKPSK